MWWMPWRLQAMKDVAACEKLRGAGKRALIRRCPNGETHPCIDGFQWELCRRVVCDDKSTPSQTRRLACGSFVVALCATTKALQVKPDGWLAGALSSRCVRRQKPHQ